MTNDEFEKLLNGPLAHPSPIFAITRLALALRHVVEAAGEPGAEALREYCRDQEGMDSLTE